MKFLFNLSGLCSVCLWWHNLDFSTSWNMKILEFMDDEICVNLLSYVNFMIKVDDSFDGIELFFCTYLK